MLELAEKDIKTAVITIYHVLKELARKQYI